MLDIKFLRVNPEIVKQNIKNKFQDSKLPLVDEVIELDLRNREIKQEVEALRAEKNKVSKQIGALMAQGKKEEAEEVQILLIRLFQSEKMTAKMWNCRNMENRLFRILKSHIIQKLWKNLMVLILKQLEK